MSAQNVHKHVSRGTKMRENVQSPDKIGQEDNKMLLNFAHFIECTEKMWSQFFNVDIWPETSKIGG